MLNIPESVKTLFKQDNIHKNFRAHFPNGELPDVTNENIVQESVRFTESVCSQDVFKFGLTEASVIEFETVGVPNMYGMTMECGIEIDCSSLSAADIADIEAGTWDGDIVYSGTGPVPADDLNGAVVTFDNANDDKSISELKVAFTPNQSGSGNPSPDNVRPIIGWDAVNVWVQHTHDTTALPEATVQLGQSVYGGVLDMTTGVLTVDRKMITFTQSSGLSRVSARQYSVSLARVIDIRKPGSVEASVFSNKFKPSTSTDEAGAVFLDGYGIITFNTTEDYSSASAMFSAIGTLEFCYPLEEPVTYQLSPYTIQPISGTNVVWADAGNIVSLKTVLGGYNIHAFRVPYGVFRVESCPRNHEAMTHRRVRAYSTSFSNMSVEMPMLPSVMPFPSIDIDPMAFAAQADTSFLTSEAATRQSYTSIARVELYDSSGNAFHLDAYGAGIVKCVYSGLTYPDFVSTDGAFDPNEGLAFGNAIADKLTELGYDLTYNFSKEKIFSNNRVALLSLAPWLFGPAVFYRPSYDSGSGTDYGYDCIMGYSVKPGLLYPVLNWYSGVPAAFKVGDKYYNPNPIGSFWTGCFILAPDMSHPTLSFRLLQGTSVDISFDPPVELPDYSSVNFIGHRLSSRSNYTIKVDNSGVEKDWRFYVYNNSKKPVKQFSYDNAFDREKIAGGALELSASFGTSARNGGYKISQLSDDNRIVFLPELYSQLWWDEYDVQPIGSVKYTYTDEASETQVTSYRFSDNPSVYDMSDNVTVAAISGGTQGAIEYLLDMYFIPNLDAVTFSPVDLEARGLPYLEAGDAITVFAQDGTEVNSYALRVEISGVQSLSMQIDSQSGLIIDSGEAAT